MRISDWSSDVCSSDLIDRDGFVGQARLFQEERDFRRVRRRVKIEADHVTLRSGPVASGSFGRAGGQEDAADDDGDRDAFDGGGSLATDGDGNQRTHGGM